jgi:hypothetical protein
VYGGVMQMPGSPVGQQYNSRPYGSGHDPSFVAQDRCEVWCALIVYNALGAFDYSHGLATQMHYPQMTEGSVVAVITAIGLGMIFNLIVVILMMLRGDIMRHFLNQPMENSKLRHERLTMSIISANVY